MSNWIGPTVKHEWNYDMYVFDNFWVVDNKHNSFLLGPIKHSSPPSKELHGYLEKHHILVKTNVVIFGNKFVQIWATT